VKGSPKISRAAAFIFWRNNAISADKKETRLNSQITAPEIRLIGADGNQVGIVPIAEALEQAGEAGLDLVEISPNVSPPVCRIMNFGKFQYEASKRKQAARKKQKQIQIKEVKFRPGTDAGDYQVKLRNLIRFLKNGDKAKVTLRFRGREMAHQELGLQLLQRVEADLMEYGTVEQHPRLEGRQMVMVINPKRTSH
jgi:translation initiation factor IF-3